MIDAVHGVDAQRKARLVKVLDIDLNWRMHQVSDGQRRRVQICVGLLRPFKVCVPVLGSAMLYLQRALQLQQMLLVSLFMLY